MTSSSSGQIPSSPVADHAVETTVSMNNMYRFTRYIYDLSRKYYLLGRDRLLREMDVQAGDHVLEIGCGTARNLIFLARLRSGVNCYGLDASTEMLETAAKNSRAAGLAQRIRLRHCLAEQLDAGQTFGLDQPFDAAFFSYSLSMIPTWPEAIQACLKNLKSGGCFYVVDFWDQADWPVWFRRLLSGWLAAFHVHFRPELLSYLEDLQTAKLGQLTLESIKGRYAYLARFQKA